MKIIFVLLISTFFTTPLVAKSVTNQELLKMCKDQSLSSQNFCFGFIISAANAAQFYRNVMDIEYHYIDICFPENVSNKEIVDLYVAWAEKNPANATHSAFMGVSTSFSIKYSCTPKKEKSIEK